MESCHDCSVNISSGSIIIGLYSKTYDNGPPSQRQGKYHSTCTKGAFQGFWFPYTVEPSNKRHVGANINSAVVSFVERLSSSRKFKMY